MGFIFNKSKKDKVVIKLWNSFWEKEKLIENYVFDNEKADAIIVTRTGIYLFKIFTEKGELTKYGLKDKYWIFNGKEQSTIINPIISLQKIENHLRNVFHDSNVPIFICNIFSESKFTLNEYIYNVSSFRDSLLNNKKCLSNEDVNAYYDMIIKNNSEKLLNE